MLILYSLWIVEIVITYIIYISTIITNLLLNQQVLLCPARCLFSQLNISLRFQLPSRRPGMGVGFGE